MYSLDTSMFMDWQARYYPIDVFDSLRVKLETLIASGEAQAVELVREELHAVAPPVVQAWAKTQSGLFLPLDADLQSAGAAIEAAFPDRHYVPDACRELGIPCINLLGLLRREKWSL